jgi:hypothetical protein
MGFEAMVIEHGRPKAVLAARRGEAGLLPVGEASENWDIAVPERVLGERGSELVVRYRQPARESFHYVLLSGAYWAGAIRTFVARVNDPGRRVTRARLDGLPPLSSSGHALLWKLEDYEPKDALTLELD